MRRLTAATFAATAAVLPAACGTTPEPDAPAAKPSAPAPAPSKSIASLRPTPEQEKTGSIALTAIDPVLTVKGDRTISRSVSVCDDIRKDKDEANMVKNAAYRYNGGDAHVDEAKGARIVEAVKAAYCKA
ncbi:hypothetical protein R1T08_31505 [Streptomyces sp. SBC-4]|nr:hypothetical protein [Streptomyces sp. SBC-4]MDV5148572.1 hypothetical protein [Streptomyces sp. SBC-4]